MNQIAERKDESFTSQKKGNLESLISKQYLFNSFDLEENK